MRRNSTIIIILIAAIIILAVTVGFFLSNQNLLPAPLPALTSPTSNGAKPTLSPTPTAVTDGSNLFSIALPDGWKVTAKEGERGLRISYISAESPDFRLRSDESVEGPFIPQYYERGARINIHTMRGPGNVAGQGSRPIAIDNVPGWFQDQNQPSTAQGQDLQANVERDGVTYAFSFSYNPDTYPEGEQVFLDILNSFLFL